MKFSRYNKKKRNLTKYIIFLFVILLILYSIFIGLHYSTKEFFKKKIFIFFDYLSEDYDYKLKKIELNTLNYIDKSEIINFFESYYNESIFLIPVEKILKEMMGQLLDLIATQPFFLINRKSQLQLVFLGQLLES